MTKEISHRYLKDKDNNIYFPVTHVDAVQGLDADNLSQVLDTLNNLVTDTGWMDIQVDKNMKNGAVSDGFKCGIREIRISGVIIHSIRLNISDINGSSVEIAKVPSKYIANNQSFYARTNGYRHPVTIECTANGKVTAFIHPDDQKSTTWIYQEFTWLE